MKQIKAVDHQNYILFPNIKTLRGHDIPKKLNKVGSNIGEGNGTPLQYSAWKIPWTEEPGRLQSTGSHRVGHD